MTTEEKLQHFLQSSMEDARSQSSNMVEEYRAALNKIFEEHKEEKQRQAALQIKTESDDLERQKNKEVSKAQLHIKRKLSRKQSELKEKLFAEVKNLLAEYMESPAYEQLLISQIKSAKEYAGNQEAIIYIDPADSPKLTALEAACQTQLTISEYGFLGGCRTVIPVRNILIDHSFETKLNEVKENFTFDGGISNGK